MRNTFSQWQRKDWLLSLLVCLAVSGLMATIFVVSQGGYGAGDLTAVLIWSTPLAVLLSLVARAFRSLWSRLHPVLAWLLAAVLGLAAGFLWTMAVALLMGPWFGAFSLPVWLCWMGGGLGGLVAASAVHVRNGRRHLGALVLPIALLLLIGYPPVTARITGSEQIQLVFLRHTPGPEALVILDERGRLTGEERESLIASGLTGQVRLEGTYTGGRGRVKRALMIMNRQVETALDLPQPYGSTVLYIQEEVGFRLYPPDAPTQPLPIRVKPAESNTNHTLMEVWQRDGSRVATTGFGWVRP